MKQYGLADLRTFTAVVESGSFRRAADRLDTSSASVSRRISGLEEALGVRLLNRTTRKLSLTDAGQQYYHDIDRVLESLQESDEKLLGGANILKGRLRLAAPMSFGIQSIAPLLPRFLKLHPGLQVDLKLEDKQTDLHAEGIDLAIRIGKLADSSLVATRLCDIEFGYFASPEYLQHYGQPTRLEELVDHQCLHYSLVDRNREWGIQDRSLTMSGALSTNNGEVLREAAIQGVGIVALPRFIVQDAVDQGQLNAILPEFTPPPSGLYALYLFRRFTPLKVKLFVQYLRENL